MPKSLPKLALYALAVLTALSLTACMRQAQLKNVTAHPIYGPTGGKLTQEQARSAILAGCRIQGWTAREDGPGHITAVIEKRGKHEAQVDIPYTAESYSINYRSSSGLKYDDKRQTIHNQYNNWVDYLKRAIDAQMAKS